MQPKSTCPDCGFAANWVSSVYECAGPPLDLDIIETDSFFCPLCKKRWEIQRNESGGRRVSRPTAEFERAFTQVI
jgi:hypothetical protein